MSGFEKYEVAGQQRILNVLIRLAGHEVNGLTPGEVAQAAGTRPANATRDLANLAIAGLAEQIPETKRWRLAPKLIQIALAYTAAMQRAENKLSETKQRFSRDPS